MLIFKNISRKGLRKVSFAVLWQATLLDSVIVFFLSSDFVWAKLQFLQLNLKKGSRNEGILSKSYQLHIKHKWDASRAAPSLDKLGKKVQCSLSIPTQQLLHLED